MLRTGFTDWTPLLKVAVPVNFDLGEGPVWDASDGTLIFVDCNVGQIHRLNPATGALATISTGKTIGAALPRLSGGLVATSDDGLLSVSETGETSLLVPIEADLPGSRMNDAKCDSRGRLWGGTFSKTFERGAGSLYRIDRDLAVSRAVSGVRVSNGIAWNADESRMYFNDTLSFGIDVFAYDREQGKLANRKRLIEVHRSDGLVDGMAVDREGCIWVALFYGGQVRRYSPDGTWIGVINLPASRATSCNFGGPGLADLYITTARFDLHDDGRPHEPEAGYVFRCRTGIKGLPSYPFAG